MASIGTDDNCFRMPKAGFKSTGHHCCAVGCNHKNVSGKCSFYSFPSDVYWRDKWIAAIKRCAVDDTGKILPNKKWTPAVHHRVCSCHFTNPPNSRSRKRGWNHVLPDKLPGVKQPTPRKTVKATGRTYCQPATKKRRINTQHQCIEDSSHLLQQSSTDSDDITTDNANPICISLAVSQHELDDHDYLHTARRGHVAKYFDEMQFKCSEFNDFLEDFKHANQCKDRLLYMEAKGQILSLVAVKDNPDTFRYYTGLPHYDVFRSLYDYLSPVAVDMQYVSNYGKTHNSNLFKSKPGPSRTMTLEEEFFATLVRLRLGLPSKDLAKRFGVAESTFSDIFNTWVILIAKELEQICSMPTPANNTGSKQAKCFDSFDNVRIVLDCTEVFSQTPGSLSAHKHMHSNYKHHSTVKFLVGMSPSGAIIYVSNMWGGRASDKKITSMSEELLLGLKPGDKVMVDRGFTIAKELPDGVSLLIPHFKDRQTGQFTKSQLEFSEKISVARIHVERAMRAIKDCHILSTEVKLAMINNYENIFKACAYLVNFKRPFLKV